MKKKIFNIVYDKTIYFDFHRCYKKIAKMLYFRYFIKRLRFYIYHYREYQFNQTRKY